MSTSTQNDATMTSARTQHTEVAEQQTAMNRITDSLADLQADVVFACSGQIVLPSNSQLVWRTEDGEADEVREGRAERLPLSAAAVTGLCSVGDTASFAIGKLDVIDPTYRQALKLEAHQFALLPGFDPGATGIVAAAARLLVPYCEPSSVRAELYKLNVYGPGGFFRSHVDTARVGQQAVDAHGRALCSHVGSLVVCLPQPLKGGVLTVRHAGRSVAFDWGSALSSLDASAELPLQWAAFYADAEHDITPVTEGHRLTITYHLFAETVAPVLRSALTGEAVTNRSGAQIVQGLTADGTPTMEQLVMPKAKAGGKDSDEDSDEDDDGDDNNDDADEEDEEDEEAIAAEMAALKERDDADPCWDEVHAEELEAAQEEEEEEAEEEGGTALLPEVPAAPGEIAALEAMVKEAAEDSEHEDDGYGAVFGRLAAGGIGGGGGGGGGSGDFFKSDAELQPWMQGAAVPSHLPASVVGVDMSTHPLYKALQAALADATAMPGGGLLGYRCAHAYAHHTQAAHAKAWLPTTMKGADAIVVAIVASLGLQIRIRPTATLETLVDGDKGEYDDDDDDGDGNQTYRAPMHHPLWDGGAAGYYTGGVYTPRMTMVLNKPMLLRGSGGMEGDDSSAEKMITRWKNVPTHYEPIKWINNSTASSQPALGYSSWGNNADPATDYSELAILIHWPKAGTQGRPAFDVKEAWKREAGYRAAAEKERAAETAAREAERKKYMAQFNPAAAEEEEGEEEAEAKEDEDGDEHTDEDADDEGEGDDEEEE